VRLLHNSGNLSKLAGATARLKEPTKSRLAGTQGAACRPGQLSDRLAVSVLPSPAVARIVSAAAVTAGAPAHKTQAKRLVRKLKAIREDMLDRMHTPVREQHR
jgi:hypothetical protein